MSIYLINDGSKDHTLTLLDHYISSHEEDLDTIPFKVPVQTRDLVNNTRKAGTYLEAFREIDADIIVTVDADDAFKVEDMVRMIHILRMGYYDLVVASKDKSKESRAFVRNSLSFGKRMLTKPFLPQGVTDSQTGLKVFKKEMIRELLPYLNAEYGLAMDLEILYLVKKMKFRTKQLAVEIIDREGSHVDVVKDTIRFLKSMVRMSMKQDYRRFI